MKVPRTTTKQKIEVYLTEEEKTRLRLICEAENVSMSDFIRTAMIEKLANWDFYKALRDGALNVSGED